ncbi:hypothetical protein SD70_22355 [Gordoniibacillus kamchatkensis]|uniref:Uncharacterized protein n=1 Tax=Gordoniibacillus kamchatkensis TaxID=1590651 RepID=A0ABR5ADD3_9BACL|nr:hypothetical protein [Paenibacillus sp. VKM B-2647]KIL39071.1 hypothetical protein SD70_22355 [Paenibacillus sp. VKM B-2647]
MRKKWLTVGAGFGIGAVMLVASGMSAMASTSGYDAYKTALNNTKAEKSLTAIAEVTITDNGAKVLAGTANIKLNHDLDAGSVAATIEGGTQTHSANVYRQDGKVVFKSGDDDVYRVMEHNAPKWQHEGVAPNPPKAVEQVFDALMGNVRELATVESEADGSKLAALHLSGSQIPAVVNALGSMVVSKAADGKEWDHGKWNHGKNDANPPSAMKVDLPKLTDNVQVQTINLDAKISPDNVLEQQQAEIKVTGTDEAGKQHVLVIQLHVDLSGFNQTTPERIDLTGKQTEEIRHDGAGRGWHH